jgi:hypothetical protein
MPDRLAKTEADGELAPVLHRHGTIERADASGALVYPVVMGGPDQGRAASAVKDCR